MNYKAPNSKRALACTYDSLTYFIRLRCIILTGMCVDRGSSSERGQGYHGKLNAMKGDEGWLGIVMTG